ncbi:MAG: ATP synthase F1 subunit epsilon [Pirellulaceae bacterium]
MSKLHVSIVTPETTTFDQDAESLVVPLFDGEAGIQADHAPMIGRMAPGELRVVSEGNTHRFYVDGGFVQVNNNQVSVITGRSLEPSTIDVESAKKTLAETQITAADKAELVDLKNKTIAQARAQLRVAEKS